MVNLSLFDRNHIGRRTFSKSPTTTHGRQSLSFRNYNARQYDFERYSVLVWYFHTGIYFLADSLPTIWLEKNKKNWPPTYYRFTKMTIMLLTVSQDDGVCNVTGICLTVPRPRASRLRWAANNRNSFFSSSFKLLQYLEGK